MRARSSFCNAGRLRWLFVAAMSLCATSTRAANLDQLLLKEDNAGASALADDQVRRADAAGPAHGAEQADALEQRAWVAFIAGEISKPSIADDLNRALTLREADGHPGSLARSLALLAVRALALGQKDQCRDLLTRALAIAEASARDHAFALSVHGGYASLIADYPTAQLDFETANVIFTDGRGADGLMLSRNLVIRAVRHRLNDDAGARADALLAIKTVIVQPGPRSRAYARALSQLGAIESFGGEYRSARRDLERALTISREHASGKATLPLAQLLQNLGNLCLLAGDPQLSRRYYGEALDILHSVPGVDPQTVFVTSSNLGEVETVSGNYHAAIERLESALAIGIKALGENNERLAGTYMNLADAYLATGATDAARKSYTHALELRRAGLGENQPLLAGPIEGLGKTHLSLREFDQGRIDFERALAIRSRRGAEHRDTAGALLGLAQAHWGIGDLQQAFDLALHAERVRLEDLRRNAPALSEREGIAFSAQANSAVPLLLQLALILDTDVARNQTWTMLMAERGLITDAMAWRAAQARAEQDPRLRADWELWRKASARYAKAALDAERAPTAESVNSLAQLRDDLDRSEHALAEHMPATRNFIDENAASLGHALGANETLIAFASAELRRPQDPYLPGQQLPRSLYALRLDAGQIGPHLFPVGATAAVGDKVAYWYNALRDANTPSAVVQSAGAELRERIWEPLATGLTARRVFIVPDGALFRVNWSALPVGERYLIESGFQFHLLDHERELLVARSDEAFGSSLLIAGAPDFDAGAAGIVATSTIASLQRGVCGQTDFHFAPLPGAEREATLLAKEGQRHGSAQLLLGRQASEETLRHEAPGADNIHLATHGFAFGERCSANHESQRGFDLAPSAVNATTPAGGQTAGLALAGANHGGADPEHDGLLTGEEIAALDLHRVRWVVLSACDSGLGQVIEGEGVFGLRRGFHIAGARSVIMSLWPVADATTTDWMLALYQARFERKLDTATAIHDTTLAALTARREAGLSTHPYYWASFVAAGDWR